MAILHTSRAVLFRLRCFSSSAFPSKNNIVESSYRKAKIGSFFQQEPVLHNQYLGDKNLQIFLKRHLPEQHFPTINIDLIRFGERVASDIYEIGIECERNPPKLETFNAWGRRSDRLITSDAWKRQKVIAAEEKLINLAYHRECDEWSRLYQMSKLYLYSPSSGLYSCPLAMTDGAAKVIENLPKTPETEEAYERLTSCDPDKFWTSGQWMTERGGGSDVGSGTETFGVSDGDGAHLLSGYKWFSSATDADVSLALGRIKSADRTISKAGLSLFLVKMRDSAGNLNGIEIQRLKEKLGTRQLPTAELLLDECRAHLISTEGRGVSSISGMLNITRLHNSISASAVMRRIISLAIDYSKRRSAFGRTLDKHKLHVKTLADMEVESRGATLLTLEVARLLGLDDCGKISEDESNLLRLLTPIAKLFTAKLAVKILSEGLECFGGMGYLEDTGLPTLFRDAQVLPIWEGTTNVLSADVLRCIARSRGQVLKSLKSRVEAGCKSEIKQLQLPCEQVLTAMDHTLEFISNRPEEMEVAARQLSFSIARIFTGTLLIEQADNNLGGDAEIFTAQRWCSQELSPLNSTRGQHSTESCERETMLLYAN